MGRRTCAFCSAEEPRSCFARGEAVAIARIIVLRSEKMPAGQEICRGSRRTAEPQVQLPAPPPHAARGAHLELGSDRNVDGYRCGLSDEREERSVALGGDDDVHVQSVAAPHHTCAAAWPLGAGSEGCAPWFCSCW